MKRLTKKQMMKVAKRILKPEFFTNPRIEVKSGVDEKGFSFSFLAVCYGENYFIGEEILRMNASPEDLV